MIRLVIDTNVLTGAMLSARGGDRRVLRACLERRVQPIVGQALLRAYEDVLGLENGGAGARERGELVDALLAVSEWVTIYGSWRPDAADHHLAELAVAGRAERIVTHNRRQRARVELVFPGVRVVSPARLMEELR